MRRSAPRDRLAVTTVLLALLGGQPARAQVPGEQPAPALVAVPVLDATVSRPLIPPAPAPAGGAASPVEQAAPVPREPAPATGNGITLTSVHDGATLTLGEPPFVIVEGQVESLNGAALWLVANDRRIPVAVHAGRFRQALPVLEATLVVWAETRTPGGQLDRWSRPVTVTAASPTPSGLVLVAEWPGQAPGLRAEISAVWRERPERPGPLGHPVALKPFRTGTDRDPPEIFHLEQPRPGVYTLLLRYENAGSAGEVRVLLHSAEAGRLQIRERRLVAGPGAGTLVLARVLLPHGIHWDQDEWFSGRSENGQIVAKFRFPEGITWSERKADLE
jgi:hypothetical protein